jgi:hypothetical protein
VILLATLVILPGAAMATEEPYSGGGVTTTTLAPAVTVAAEGLDVSFTARGQSGDCTWDFGDGTTGTGNPVEHVYAADGTYDVTATCGATVLSRTLTFAAGLSFTGFDAGTFVLIAAILGILGAGALWATRRSRANN